VAALTAIAGTDSPDKVATSDLDRFAELAERALFNDQAITKLLYVWFNNYPATQASWPIERRRSETARLLRLYADQPQPDLPPCAFCGRPSVLRAARDLIPMLSGRETRNFFPSGRSPLPVCGVCGTALQAALFGAPRCEGKAIVVSADEPHLTASLVSVWTRQALQRAQLTDISGDSTGWRHPRTRVLHQLLELLPRPVEESEMTGADREVASALVVYHLTNSGQGPDVRIHTWPAAALRFAQRARAAANRVTWDALVDQAWQERRQPAGGKTAGQQQADDTSPEQRRNALYEDLFTLPASAGSFLRRHFLRLASRLADDLAALDAERIRLWHVTRIFLEEVVGMEARRIGAIRQLGDRVATAISQGDRRLFSSLRGGNSYRDVRGLLLRAGTRYLQEHGELLLSFDDFLLIFEEGEEVARADWRLAWDLVFLRVLEQLHACGWFTQHKDALDAMAQQASEGEDSESAPDEQVDDTVKAIPLPV
jgi:CRISPR-associated protein Cst1